jgi:rubrerythrin
LSDPRAKDALSEMAEEEMNHFKYLRHQYKAILDNGNYDFAKEFTKKREDHGQNPIFSQAIKERIKDSHYEVSVLTIGMKLEMEAVQFYKACAENAESEEAKRFYKELEEWEQDHYHAFQQELDMLKEDYWQANSFIPM